MGRVEAGDDRRARVERKAEADVLPEDVARARERGRGRNADSPTEIPPAGWSDVFWRMVRAFSANRIIAMSGGVAFFTLLAIFPAIATVVSLYGLFANAQTVIDHLNVFAGILPAGILDLFKQQILLVAG